MLIQLIKFNTFYWVGWLKKYNIEEIIVLYSNISCILYFSDGSVVSFHKTAVAVLASLAVYFKNRGCGCNAVVLKAITAVSVVGYYIRL